MPKTLILIPSRMAASRLPWKPLLKINNLSIILHVYERAKKANIGDVVVATQDLEILEEVEKNGGKAILTGNQHKTGTDRIFECFKKLKISDVDYIINLQGDEPLINISDIKNLIEYTNDNKLDLVTTKKDFIKIDKLSLNKIKYLDINLVIKDEIKLLKKIIWKV